MGRLAWMLQHQQFLNNVFGKKEEQKMAPKAEDVIILLWSGFGKCSPSTLGHIEAFRRFKVSPPGSGDRGKKKKRN